MAPVASSQSSSSASSAGVRGVGVRRLRSQLAIKAGLTQKQAERFLKALVEEVEERVLSDGQLRIPGLVVFKMKARAARPAGKKVCFGKEVSLRALAERRVLTASCAKGLAARFQAVAEG
jgi:nucleoid DNA-binding protein